MHTHSSRASKHARYNEVSLSLERESKVLLVALDLFREYARALSVSGEGLMAWSVGYGVGALHGGTRVSDSLFRASGLGVQVFGLQGLGVRGVGL